MNFLPIEVDFTSINKCASFNTPINVEVVVFGYIGTCIITPMTSLVVVAYETYTLIIDLEFVNLSKGTDPIIKDFLVNKPNEKVYGCITSLSEIQKTNCIFATMNYALFFVTVLMKHFKNQVYHYAVWYCTVGRRMESERTRFERTISYMACCAILKIPNFQNVMVIEQEINLYEFIL